MGRDKVRYLVYVSGRWRWRPTKTMRQAGFGMINLSPGILVNGEIVPTAEDMNEAIRLNEAWDRHRRGLPESQVAVSRYPKGSVGDGYQRAMALREQERKAKGIVWTKERASRDDWPRAWKWIEPLFGDCDPKTITPEQLIGDPRNPEIVGLRPLVATRVSETEAHRTIKIWRALWQRMAVFGFCDRGRDPSFTFANSAPKPRQAVWSEGEAVRLVKTAWRKGYHGLAAVMAVAWDTQLSPVDVRLLTAGQMTRDASGTYFVVDRAKTGRTALGTLSRRTDRCLMAYLETCGAAPLSTSPIFRNRSGRAYSKDTLGDDFRDVRALVFGPGETRQLADFRRSGSVEALAGDIQPEKLSTKMANSLSTSNRLHMTYGPVRLASVRDTDEARKRGRAKLREQRPDKSVIAPAQKCHEERSQRPKPLK